MSANELLEPWLRGPVEGVHPVIGAVVHAFQQAREDLAAWTEGFSAEQVWARPQGVSIRPPYPVPNPAPLSRQPSGPMFPA